MKIFQKNIKYRRDTLFNKDGIVVTDQRIILQDLDDNENKYDLRNISLEQYLKKKIFLT